MKNEKMKNLILGTMIAFLIMGFIPFQTNAQTPVKGDNVTKVVVGNANKKVEGILIQTGPKTWTHYYPDGKRIWTTHTETGRDEWSVYLDSPKYKSVTINLWKKTATFIIGDKTHLRPILSSSNDPIKSTTPNVDTANRTAETNPLGPAPLSNADMAQVMKWIATKVSAIRVPYCYRKSETRGAGKPLSNKCAAGMEDDAGLCYPKCKQGYSGAATTCSADCPAGFKDIGLFCQKPSGTYGRGGGFGWKPGDPVGNYDRARQRCVSANSQGCEKLGLIWYPKCKAGYKATTANICAPTCPNGYADTGTGCRKPTYQRASRGEPRACAPGLIEGRDPERSGLLCYPTCKNRDYEGIGPVCWQQCPTQQPVGCGFGCSLDKKTCASVTSSQVISPIMAAVSLATLGSAAAAKKAADAAKAGANAGKIIKAVEKTSKLARIANELKRLKLLAKLSTMQAVGGPQNMGKLIKAGKVIQIGYKFYVANKTLKAQHDLFKTEFSKNFAKQTSPEIAREIESRFGPRGAEYIRQEWADKHLSMMVEADAWATAKNVITLASVADPTGLASVVNAYLHPICKESAVFPNIRILSTE